MTTLNEHGKEQPEHMQVVLPEKILEFLINQCGLQLRPELIRNYWEHLERVQDPFALDTASYREAAGGMIWPLGFYGDEAQVGLQNNPGMKIWGLFMNVILWRPKATRLARFLLYCVQSDRVASVSKTIYPVLQALTQSFNKLTEQGVCNTRCLVTEIRGDQAFFRFLFKHASWWRTKTMCFRCGACADDGPLRYTLYESNDGWNTTLRSTAYFLRHELPSDPDELCATLSYPSCDDRRRKHVPSYCVLL